MTKFRKRSIILSELIDISHSKPLTAASGVALLGRAVSGVALLVARGRLLGTGSRLLGVLLALSRGRLLVAATASQRA